MHRHRRIRSRPSYSAALLCSAFALASCMHYVEVDPLHLTEQHQVIVTMDHGEDLRLWDATLLGDSIVGWSYPPNSMFDDAAAPPSPGLRVRRAIPKEAVSAVRERRGNTGGTAVLLTISALVGVAVLAALSSACLAASC